MVDQMLLFLHGDDPTEIINGPSGRDVAVDTETKGLRWSDALLGISMAWRSGPDNKVKKCYLGDPRSGQMPLFDVDGTVGSDIVNYVLQTQQTIMHNHPFDFRTLYKHLGVQPIPRVVDTMHVARNIGSQNSASLVALYEKYVGPIDPHQLAMKAKRKTLASLDFGTASEYAEEDAEMTLLLAENLRPLTKGTPYSNLHNRDTQFCYTVMQMVERGLPVDREFIKERIIHHHQEMMRINQELIRVGIRNPTSPPDVMGYIKSNKVPATDTASDSLEPLADRFPPLKGVVDYRQYGKAVSSWYEPLLDLSDGDGRFHSMLNPFGTRSYRMSSNDLNAQAIPLESKPGGPVYGNLTGIFKSPDPDFELWALDMKQAEVRLSAVISGDIELMDTLMTGEDPYTSLAIRMWNDARRRSNAKQAMLSSIYEVGPKTFAMRYGVSEAVAREILDQFRSSFPTLRKYSVNCRFFTENKHYTPLCTGRQRWLSDDERGTEYKAFNQTVQGSVAEVMSGVMMKIEDAYPGQLLLQVHDSVVMMMPSSKTEREKQMSVIANLVQETVVAIVPNQKKFNRMQFLVDAKPWQRTVKEK